MLVDSGIESHWSDSCALRVHTAAEVHHLCLCRMTRCAYSSRGLFSVFSTPPNEAIFKPFFHMFCLTKCYWQIAIFFRRCRAWLKLHFWWASGLWKFFCLLAAASEEDYYYGNATCSKSALSAHAKHTACQFLSMLNPTHSVTIIIILHDGLFWIFYFLKIRPICNPFLHANIFCTLLFIYWPSPSSREDVSFRALDSAQCFSCIYHSTGSG